MLKHSWRQNHHVLHSLEWELDLKKKSFANLTRSLLMQLITTKNFREQTVAKWCLPIVNAKACGLPRNRMVPDATAAPMKINQRQSFGKVIL